MDGTRWFPNEWFYRYIDPIIDFIGIYIKKLEIRIWCKITTNKDWTIIKFEIKYSLIRDLSKNYFKISF